MNTDVQLEGSLLTINRNLGVADNLELWLVLTVVEILLQTKFVPNVLQVKRGCRLLTNRCSTWPKGTRGRAVFRAVVIDGAEPNYDFFCFVIEVAVGGNTCLFERVVSFIGGVRSVAIEAVAQIVHSSSLCGLQLGTNKHGN